MVSNSADELSVSVVSYKQRRHDACVCVVVGGGRVSPGELHEPALYTLVLWRGSVLGRYLPHSKNSIVLLVSPAAWQS